MTVPYAKVYNSLWFLSSLKKDAVYSILNQMNIFLVLLLCFVPLIAVFLIFKFTLKTKTVYQLFSVLFGLLAVLPITFLQFYLDGFSWFNSNKWISVFLKAIIFNGLIEEMLKMVFLFLLPSRKMTLGQFFTCALLCGLTLSCFESIVYFLKDLQQANATGAQLLYNKIFIRMITSDLIHTFCTGLAGLFVWSIKNKWCDICALILPVIFHGLYNLFTQYTPAVSWFSWFAFAAILFAALECRIHYVLQKPFVQNPKTGKVIKVQDETLCEPFVAKKIADVQNENRPVKKTRIEIDAAVVEKRGKQPVRQTVAKKQSAGTEKTKPVVKGSLLKKATAAVEKTKAGPKPEIQKKNVKPAVKSAAGVQKKAASVPAKKSAVVSTRNVKKK